MQRKGGENLGVSNSHRMVRVLGGEERFNDLLDIVPQILPNFPSSMKKEELISCKTNIANTLSIERTTQACPQGAHTRPDWEWSCRTGKLAVLPESHKRLDPIEKRKKNNQN